MTSGQVHCFSFQLVSSKIIVHGFYPDNSGSTASGGVDNQAVVPMHDIFDILDGDLKRKVRQCRLPPEKLILGDVIGSGSFGVVYKGELSREKGDVVVAVKTLRSEFSSFLRKQNKRKLSGTLVLWFLTNTLRKQSSSCFSESFSIQKTKYKYMLACLASKSLTRRNPLLIQSVFEERNRI